MSMTLIEHIEVGSGGATEVEFTSIPQTYTDLYLLCSARTDSGYLDDGITVKPNSATTNYSARILLGSGTAAASSTRTNFDLSLAPGASATSNTFSSTAIYFPNYASSNNKSMSSDSVIENNATATQMRIYAALWSDTAAITSLLLESLLGTNILQYSTFTLYGITAGSDGTTTVS